MPIRLGRWRRFLFVLAREAERRWDSFDKQDTTNTACAFATAAMPDGVFFLALANAVGRRVGEFAAQIPNVTTQALATTGQKDEMQFAAHVIAVERHRK